MHQRKFIQCAATYLSVKEKKKSICQRR